MTRNHVLKLVAWLRHSGIRDISELLLFQISYFHVYKRADIRCMYCYADYCNTGYVPQFVIQFVRHTFLKENRNESNTSSFND